MAGNFGSERSRSNQEKANQRGSSPAAAAGLDPRWFAFSWFDPLRSDPAFPARAVAP